jgi:RNA polymerase sigma-32 factor
MAYTSHELVDRRVRRAANCAPMLDACTELDYLRRIQANDDPTAMRELLASHLRLVLSIAQKYTGHGIALDDLIAEGNLGLIEAARRFDFGKASRFSTYAAWWVRALVRRYTLDNRRIVRAPSTRNARRLWSGLRKTQRELAQELGRTPTLEQLAARLCVSTEEVEMVEMALRARDVPVGAQDAGAVDVPASEISPEDEAAEREARERNIAGVRRALAKLAPRERAIIERRLLSDEGETLSEIGHTLGLSRERVRQLEKRACDALRGELTELVA